jgi:hypothetical protein
MMRVNRAMAAGLAVWLAALTVLTAWPVVGNAPWEHGGRIVAADRRVLLCRDALARRQVALGALATPRREGDLEYSPSHRQTVYSPSIPAWTEAERQLKAAQDDIDRLC